MIGAFKLSLEIMAVISPEIIEKITLRMSEIISIVKDTLKDVFVSTAFCNPSILSRYQSEIAIKTASLPTHKILQITKPIMAAIIILNINFFLLDIFPDIQNITVTIFYPKFAHTIIKITKRVNNFNFIF